MIGQSVSHYRIVEKLGEGGMGVVYKAEDTKLERTVALKFLAAHLLNDEEAKQRFLREAKSAAALHHPNICTVYEVDEAEGKTFLAMAFLKGETLEDRIAKGPLPLKDAFDIGRQVAEGLAAAHAEGIVHRDIKPANILVSPEGRATIMDFGLARLTEASKLTRADQTVGTAAYMSPEQIQGGEVDQRADIWALGCVLYETVAGLRPFKGQYDQALAYEIVNQEPEPLTGVRAGVPMELEFTVGKCLAKDRGDRPGSAEEVGRELRTLSDKLKSGRSTILRTAQMTGAALPVTGGSALYPAAILPPDSVVLGRGRLRLERVVAAVLGVAAVGLAVALFTRQPPPPAEKLVRRFSMTPEELAGGAISPDGKHVAYVTRTGAQGLWVRSLATEASRELPGTQDADGDVFWSPDSAWVGFITGQPGRPLQLRKVSIDGGAPVSLADLPGSNARFSGGTWSPEGDRIVFASDFRLYQVDARGGQPQLLFDPGDGDWRNSTFPQFLPAAGGPPALVYTAARGPSDTRLEVLNLETGERRELAPGRRASYSEEGFLVHEPTDSTDSGLWAIPFSRKTLETTGQSFPISPTGRRASLSRDGTLAFVEAGNPTNMKNLVWRSRTGQVRETVGQPQAVLREFALSPDGRFVATTANDSDPGDIWIQDLARSTKTRLTFEAGSQSRPSWSGNGREILYSVNTGGTRSKRPLMRKSADGAGQAAALFEVAGIACSDWSRDSRFVAYQFQEPEGTIDIGYVDLETQGQPEPTVFVSTPFDDKYPKLSPDARFVAYVSNESGRFEVYVQPFPSGAGRWQASVNGGEQPRWRADGKELYYVETDTLMAVSVSDGAGGLAFGRPERLFRTEDLLSQFGWPEYDVTADGQSFLTAAPVEEKDQAPPAIRLVENWYEEFRDRD